MFGGHPCGREHFTHAPELLLASGPMYLGCPFSRQISIVKFQSANGGLSVALEGSTSAGGGNDVPAQVPKLYLRYDRKIFCCTSKIS